MLSLNIVKFFDLEVFAYRYDKLKEKFQETTNKNRNKLITLEKIKKSVFKKAV